MWNRILQAQKSTFGISVKGYLYVPLCADSVDFVDEYDTWRVFFCDAEEFSHELGTVAEVFLDQLGAYDTQEGSGCLVCYCFGKKRLSCAGYTVENNAFWRLDTHFFV